MHVPKLRCCTPYSGSLLHAVQSPLPRTVYSINSITLRLTQYQGENMQMFNVEENCPGLPCLPPSPPPQHYIPQLHRHACQPLSAFSRPTSYPAHVQGVPHTLTHTHTNSLSLSLSLSLSHTLSTRRSHTHTHTHTHTNALTQSQSSNRS